MWTNLYSLYKTELLKEYKEPILNAAVRIWRKNGIKDDTLADKAEKLGEQLERASKKEFIALYRYYVETVR